MQGCIQKMTTTLESPVSYKLPVGDVTVDLNPLLGQKLQLRYSGRIFCVHCHKKTSKSFNQGYCYPCFQKLAQCDMCIMKPETCHFDNGTCREPDWGKQFCYQPHTVYLANSSGLKVGITRNTQVPTRWIDQGAIQALPVIETTSRHISGVVEVAFAEFVQDKTNWQQMLKNNTQPLDLKQEFAVLLEKCQGSLDKICGQFGENALRILADASPVDIHYPVLTYPSKIKSFNLDKDPLASGVLQGIKGQYLLFDTGVINIRKYTGYELEVSV